MTENGFLHSALRSRNMVIGLGLTAVFVIGTLLSLIWTPHDVTALEIGNKLQTPRPHIGLARIISGVTRSR